jgi:hypothetical protein
MKLIDLINDIDNIEVDKIIFQADLENLNSDIILAFPVDDVGALEEHGTKYFYLIEVFLAKEFLEDWEQNLGYKLSLDEKAKRLHEYAINDA